MIGNMQATGDRLARLLQAQVGRLDRPGQTGLPPARDAVIVCNVEPIVLSLATIA
ncbi:hypothetical protein [Sphingomonas sp. 22176]|uniref:hypothetical protein n=1 Tax=Sphingomonas sp. 22176 TaxID=3453884 RepID=UPI003F86D0CA